MDFRTNRPTPGCDNCLFIDPTHSTMQQYNMITVVNWSEYTWSDWKAVLFEL